jgi:hypothetical protein
MFYFFLHSLDSQSSRDCSGDFEPFFLKTGFAIKEFCLNEPKREREKKKRDSLELEMGRGKRAVGELGFV